MITIDITLSHKSWIKERAGIKKFIKDLIKKIIPDTELNQLLKEKIKIEISVVLSNDEEIKILNKNYRKIDKATNVLSFPTISKKDLKKRNFTGNILNIGDIIFALETIKSEALEQNKKFEDHLTHLIIHSILHLIGYDHQTKKEAEIMENLEIELLKKLAIHNPYIIK